MSWADLLRSRKGRGMRAPVLAIGDGALGFWNALREVFPLPRSRGAGSYLTSNVLAALPKSAHPVAKAALAESTTPRTRGHALKAVTAFEDLYATKWPKAVAKITEHLDVLLAFYDYPAEHWIHLLRTTNPIESTFATVRLRQRVTKGPGSSAAGGAMAFKLIESDRPAGCSQRPAPGRWSVPAPNSRTANSSDGPTNQEVISMSHDTPIHRP